jgi:hypothetical protein
LGYLGELWKLWRGRRDNPLCRYGGGRRGWMVSLHGVTLLVLAGLSSLIYLLPVNNLLGLLFLFFLPSLGVFFFFVYFSFLICTFRWRTEESLTDLSLSSLSAKEVAFGMVYSPIKHCLFALVYLMIAITIFGIVISWGDLTIAFLFLFPVVFGFLPVFWIVCMMYCSQQWITQKGRPLRVLIESAPNTLGGMMVYGAVAFIIFFFFRDNFLDDSARLEDYFSYSFTLAMIALPLIVFRRSGVMKVINKHWPTLLLLLFILFVFPYLLDACQGNLFTGLDMKNFLSGVVITIYILIIGVLFVYLLIPNLFRFLHDRVYFSLDPRPLQMRTLLAPRMIGFLRQNSQHKGIGWIVCHYSVGGILGATIRTVSWVGGLIIVLFFAIQALAMIKFKLGLIEDVDSWDLGYWACTSYPFSFLCAMVLPGVFVSSLLKNKPEPLIGQNRYQIVTIMGMYALVPTLISILHFLGFNLIMGSIDGAIPMLVMVGIIIVISLMVTTTLIEQKSRRSWSLVWSLTGLIMAVHYDPYMTYHGIYRTYRPTLESNVVQTVFIVAVSLFLLIGIPTMFHRLYHQHLSPEDEGIL